jgi:hypothetical protein
MTYPCYEPTVEEIMADSAVMALMKADRVDPAQFETRLRKVGKRLRGDPLAFEAFAGVNGLRHRGPGAECRC